MTRLLTALSNSIAGIFPPSEKMPTELIVLSSRILPPFGERGALYDQLVTEQDIIAGAQKAIEKHCHEQK